jgi:lipid-A-disaccharide synthase
VWGARGSVVEGLEGLWLQPEGDHPPIPVVRDAMRYASRARMALTIPGTKCIELAALGVPTMVCAPLNAPEMVVINGPLQYLDRIPFLGVPLKRAMVLGVDKRFPLSAQPNIDAGEELMPELRGTLMPGHVARRVAEYAGDDAARAAAAQRLRALYIDHAGAAERMARSLLALGP